MRELRREQKVNNIHYILNKFFTLDIDIEKNVIREKYKEEFKMSISDEEIEDCLGEIFYTKRKIEELQREYDNRTTIEIMY